MTRHATLKTVGALAALALTAMLATSAWAKGPVHRMNARNSSIDQASVSALTSESDAVAPLSVVTLRERRFTKGQATSSLRREISLFRRFGLSDRVLAEIERAVEDFAARAADPYPRTRGARFCAASPDHQESNQSIGK